MAGKSNCCSHPVSRFWPQGTSLGRHEFGQRAAGVFATWVLLLVSDLGHLAPERPHAGAGPHEALYGGAEHARVVTSASAAGVAPCRRRRLHVPVNRVGHERHRLRVVVQVVVIICGKVRHALFFCLFCASQKTKDLIGPQSSTLTWRTPCMNPLRVTKLFVSFRQM